MNAISIRRSDVDLPVQGARAISIHPDKVVEPVQHLSGKGNKIMLPTMEGMCFEKVKHIAYLEASGNYTVLHFTDARQVLVCKTLREVEQLLPDAAFIRIHRSHTIHLRHIKKYVRGKGGYVILQNGVTLTVSSGQKDSFIEALKYYFG
jgi:two-component system LytT family response regulator